MPWRHGTGEQDLHSRKSGDGLLLLRMEAQWQHTAELHEILVRRQDGPSVSFGNRTQQKVGVRALNPFRATEGEAVCCPLVISRDDRLVRKRPQVAAKALEDRPVANATEELLPDRTDDGGAPVRDQVAQFVHRRMGWRASPQGERPDRCVDEHLHGRRRCFL